MRVDPNYITSLVQSLDLTSANEQTYTEEISSGVSLNSLSDDPAAAGLNTQLISELGANDTFSTTAGSAESMLQVTDTALGNVVTQLTNAISLATEAANGTSNSSDLATVTTQLTGIRDEVLSLANSSYLGQYLFAGSQTTTEPFTLDTSTSPASVTYNGDDGVSYVMTPTGQQIQTNMPGDQIFTGTDNVLSTLNNLIADFSSGSASASTSSDISSLNSALNYVDQQRSVLDNSIDRLSASSSYAGSESVQLQSSQNALIQTDDAKVATQLSESETQGDAITQIIAALEQQGNLFTVMQ
ncbi:flagellar hook-associated protein FlgL [Silvibacterium acidisoli]|uniref:flagellar hook-associated protein FlgL n=1 Tax=Acidobacteriaceae bacterium ZG23-2 TaxID=2883246 RepID=UPI00406CA28C